MGDLKFRPTSLPGPGGPPPFTPFLEALEPYSHRVGTKRVASSPLGVRQVAFGSFQHRNLEQGLKRRNKKVAAEDEPVT